MQPSERVRAKVAKARRYSRYGWRFASDARYRTKVLGLVNRHVDAEAIAATDAPDAFAAARPWLEGTRLYFIGGCEFTYVRELFEAAGAVTFDTFAHGRASDPLVEVGDPGSPLWEFAPDAIVVSQSELAISLVHATQWHGRTMSRQQQDDDLAAVIGSLDAALALIRQRCDAPVFVLGHPLVHRPSLGVYDQVLLGEVRGLAELVAAYRLELYELARRHDATHILDPQVILEGIGVAQGVEAATELLAEHFSRAGGREVAQALLTCLHAAHPKAPKVKVIAVDLDDTLWSGILREDGPAGVSVRRHLVKALRYYMARGILVAICSKNDPAEAPLLPDLLGADVVDALVDVHLGWGPKSAALADLAERLNLGIDSFALFDDNPRERAEVAQAHPTVRVFADTDIIRALTLPEFQPGPHLTAEAIARAESYRQQARRAKSERSPDHQTPEAFLHSLGLEVTIRPAADADLPRVAELLQRTNQLNASGRRTGLRDLEQLHRSGSGIIVVTASDRFGDYGLIGAATFTDDGGRRTLGEFAFSCRAMGRGIEGATLSYLADQAGADGLDALEIMVVATTRNAEIIRIIGEAGFTADADGTHRLQVGRGHEAVPFPGWLDVHTPAMRRVL